MEQKMKKDLKLTELTKSDLKAVNGGKMHCDCNWIYEPESGMYYDTTFEVREIYIFPQL